MARCGEIRGLLGAAVYGDLSPSEQKSLDAHLAVCAACRRERDELAQVAGLIGRADADLTAEEEQAALAGIARRVMPTRRARRRYAPRRRWLPALAASAALAAAVLLAVFSFDRSEPKPPDPPGVAASDPVKKKPEPYPGFAGTPSGRSRPGRPALTDHVPPVTPRPPRPEPPQPKPVVPRRTVAIVGSLEEVHGQVALVKEGSLVPARTGMKIAAGQAIRSLGRQSLAVLRYGDGTRVEIGPDTRVTESSDGGKKLVLERGSLRAEVVPQPGGQPLVVSTANAEARVLGTTFRMVADRASARLDVHEGRVRLTRQADGQAVEVAAGQRAVVAEGVELKARTLRVQSGLLALYAFDENGGRIIRDQSGRGVPLDLRIRGAATWGADGLAVKPAPRISTAGPASKIIRACRASGEVTLEAWFTPAQPASKFEGAIVAMSVDVPERNLTLIQAGDRYEVSLRTSATKADGKPPLATALGSVAARRTHLVYTRSKDGTERIYIDGVERVSDRRPGTLASWDESFRLTLADETTEERPWAGAYRLVAVYGRALIAAEVDRNFRMGVK